MQTRKNNATLLRAAEALKLSVNDVKIHIDRGNLKMKANEITPEELRRFKKALPTIPLLPIPDKFKKCYWLWHDGIYSAELADNEQQAREQFTKKSKAVVYSVWEV